MPIIHGIEAKYEEHDYLGLWPFADECDVMYRTVKIVKTSKEHTCMCPGSDLHPIPTGSLAYNEKAIVEGCWESTYACVRCLDKWIDDKKVGE
jgi:hypothetical protein